MTRYNATSKFDPSITQEVRTALVDAGRYDLVAEQIVDGMRDIETLARDKLSLMEERVKALELERTEFMKESGVIRVIETRQGRNLKEWVVWTARTILPWAAAAAGALLGLKGVLK